MGRRNPQYQTVLDQMGIHDVPTLTERIEREGNPAGCDTKQTVLGALRNFTFFRWMRKRDDIVDSKGERKSHLIVIDDSMLQRLYREALKHRDRCKRDGRSKPFQSPS